MRKVGVVGAGGRMGREVCRAVTTATDLELVAAVDPGHVGQRIEGVAVAGDVGALAEHGTEVVVDFSVADAARDNLPLYAREGLHAVVGTPGLSETELGAAARLFAESAANAIVAANFAIGAVLYLPFLLIDMVTAAITTSIGMFQLPPVVVSTPLKILLFVMVDGWNLVAGSLLKSF